MIKYYSYILKSISHHRYYFGSTADLQKRLKEHNKGKVRSTKAYAPWVVHYVEEHDHKSEAIKRELFFKSIEGYNWLKENNIR
jgi:putative endonuclease